MQPCARTRCLRPGPQQAAVPLLVPAWHVPRASLAAACPRSAPAHRLPHPHTDPGRAPHKRWCEHNTRDVGPAARGRVCALLCGRPCTADCPGPALGRRCGGAAVGQAQEVRARRERPGADSPIMHTIFDMISLVSTELSWGLSRRWHGNGVSPFHCRFRWPGRATSLNGPFSALSLLKSVRIAIHERVQAAGWRHGAGRRRALRRVQRVALNTPRARPCHAAMGPRQVGWKA